MLTYKKQAEKLENRLTDDEVQAIQDVLHEDRFIDLPPREIVPTRADEGRYLGSIRTFYRVLAGHCESQDRRIQARHPKRLAQVLLSAAALVNGGAFKRHLQPAIYQFPVFILEGALQVPFFGT